MGVTSDMHLVNPAFTWAQLCWHHSALGVRDRRPISELPCSLVWIHFCGPLELRLNPRAAPRLCGSWTGMLHAALFSCTNHAATSLNWKVNCVDHAVLGVCGKAPNSDRWVPTLWPTARLEGVPGTSAVGSCQGGRTYLAHPDVPFT